MRKDLQDFDPEGVTPDRHITKLVRADPVLPLLDQKIAEIFHGQLPFLGL